jgi:hypothetical protein
MLRRDRHGPGLANEHRSSPVLSPEDSPMTNQGTQNKQTSLTMKEAAQQALQNPQSPMQRALAFAVEANADELSETAKLAQQPNESQTPKS